MDFPAGNPLGIGALPMVRAREHPGRSTPSMLNHVFFIDMTSLTMLSDLLSDYK